MSYLKKGLDDLINRDEPAWPLVQEWMAKAVRPVEALSPSDSAGRALVCVQVTTRSPMGAVIYHSGGILVDHGWIRILGSGHPRLSRSLPEWNFACGLPESDSPPPWYLVADDVMGGFFALDGGRFKGSGRTLWYFAPDSLEWEDLGMGYSEFLQWCFSDRVDEFYRPWRWTGWESEVERVAGDQALSVYPPLWAKGPEVGQRSRRPVPLAELFGMNVGQL